MPVFFSLNSDVILCVLCCALLLAGAVCVIFSRERTELPGQAVFYLGAAIIILAAREWLAIVGVSEPGFISFYPVAAMMQTASGLGILMAAYSVTQRPSRRANVLAAVAVLFLLGLLAVLLLPYLSYTEHVRDGTALISAVVFFSVKFSTFAAACIFLYCVLRSASRPSRSTVAVLSVFCLHAFIVFICRPPGLAGLNDRVDVFATRLNEWLFVSRIVTAFIMVAILWNQYSRAVGVTRRIRWWPLALTVFILCSAIAFVFVSTANYRSVVRRNLIAATEHAATRIPARAVRLAAADPASVTNPAVARAVFGPVRHNRMYRGYARLACTLDILAAPPNGSGPAVPLVDIAGNGGGWARGEAPLQALWPILLDQTTFMPGGMERLEPLVIAAPFADADGSEAGLAALSVSAVDLILDQYLFKRPILLFIPVAFFGLLLLMSGQQHAWLAAHASTRVEALRRGALANGLTGILITRNHIVVDCNERVAALAGVPRERLLGADMRTAFDLPDPSLVQRAERSLFDPATPKVFELPLRRPDGATVYLLVYGRTQSGDPADPCYIWESVDITVTKAMDRELVAANHAAKQAERAKAAFLATMSHELRTPMNGIVGMADLVIENESTEPLPRLYAETIVKSAKTLQMVMDEVMDVAAIDDPGRRFTLADAPFPLLTLAEEAVQIVSCIVEAWGVELTLDYDFTLPEILGGDARQIRQVMVQILTHCSRLTADKRIHLELAAHEKGVAFRCVFPPARDIDPEELESMFKRTTTADRSGRRLADPGVFNDRIGLPLAWRLIDAMSGSLAVEQDDGRIRCEAVLPLAADASAGAQPVSPPNLAAMRILVATPDADWRRTILDCLAYAQSTVECAADAEAAAALLQREEDDGNPFDILLLDAHLHGFHGEGGQKGLLEWISLHERFGNPAVALIVSSHQVQDLASCPPNIRCLMVPPLCPSEIWYKLDGIRAALELEKLAGDTAPGGRATTVVLRRRSTRITRLIKVPASVLLVEDNTVNQMVAMGILKRLGCAATLAKNGREAVELIAAGHTFDLIFMDCMMPVMDGYEATGAIRLRERNNPGAKRNTIVALTANTVAGDRERCLAAGMDDYITKPVTLEQLRDTMARLCPELVAMVDQAEGA